jgi:hypothetical protein
MGASVSFGPPVGAMDELAQPDINKANRIYGDITISKNATNLLSFDDFNNLITN